MVRYVRTPDEFRDELTRWTAADQEGDDLDVVLPEEFPGDEDSNRRRDPRGKGIGRHEPRVERRGDA